MSDKIGFASRYYQPFKALCGMLDSIKAFELIYNDDKETHSLPYLYREYRNKLEPTTVATRLISSIKQYLNENLFDLEERTFLLQELKSEVESYGDETISSIGVRIELCKKHNADLLHLIELEKTVVSLRQIKDILKQEFSIADFMKQPIIEPSVFISYSHDSEEHKNWVLQLATRLRKNGVNIILDRWNLTLGRDLASFMEKGLSKSNRIICVCSETYNKKANNGKGGAGYEKQIMTTELVKDQDTNWVIPLIRNNPSERKTPIFLGGRLYINFDESNLYESKYEELLRDILDEPVLPIPIIGKNPFQTIREFGQQSFIPDNEKYVSPSIKGTVTFDYSNNNGRYFIGEGQLMFELDFSKASDKRIYLLNDPKSIRTVSIAKGVKEINLIADARIFDSSSRIRKPVLNEVAVLQNTNGFYAAIKILDIKDDTRIDEVDEVTFEYRIQSNGSPDFTL